MQEYTEARRKRDFFLFILTGAFLGLYAGLYDPSFNNYLNDVFHIGEVARGGLEFPRELPGFLVVFTTGLLLFLPDVRIAMVANLILALGLLGLGFLSPSFTWVVVWMMVWSVGAHLYMPLESSIGVALSKPGEEGKRLGQLGAVKTAASLGGFLLVWLGFRYFNMSYSLIFTLAGLCAVAAAVCLLLMTPRPSKTRRQRLLFKRKYMLFYWLNVLFGARKQVFLTFAPWVLIKVFNQPVTTFAALGLVCTIAGIPFRALLGRAIDKFGERAVIVTESLLLALVCLGYGFAKELGLGSLAIWLVFLCYVGDQLLFACNMARATYLNKIADSPDDLTPTLSMGLTIDHAVSMTIPFFGGLLWMKLGYQYVFLVAAAIALLNFFAALKIPTARSMARQSSVSADL
ncbi:MFS transporter [Desulforamulus putei]|uniref:Predicted arabinose efflux permease, MFS family n=1 Tax=Desulforamulus putei DSM 12395 TaxID=1121429 RepID=A0A1M4VWW2_9FIRM|nr:MFS transporter [Desulforamulus putei]SHE73400.1 Predicted arabinose efflux permease, MFS family [Desulforamulus putei DSM 12395]